MNTNYPTIISVDHEPNHRLYETPYNTYSNYPDYATPTSTSKLEAFDYNCWPGTPTTHNILTIPPPSSATSSIIDQLQPSPSTSQTIETLVPGPSSVHLSQISSSSAISSTHHHHHHIHQHLYPTSTSSSTDSSGWLPPTDYPTPNSYRHYSYGNNTFYEQSQWPTPTPSLPPIKFESPYSPQPYFESPHNLDQPLSDSKEEPSNSSYTKCQETQSNWFKSQVTPTPPKNPVNGMSHIFN